MMRHIYFYFFSMLLFTTALINAQTPSTLSLQGVLRDNTGAAVANGTYAMSFSIYSAATGGSALWTEAQNSVAVQNGVFNVQLGAVTALSSLAFNQQYWIGVTAGGIEMSPRITLTAAPYTMGFKGTANVFGSSGNVGIGTLTPSANLQVVGSMVTDNATVNSTATIGTANISNLNTNTTSLGNTTINGTATITSNASITGTLAVGSAETVAGTIKSGTQTAVVANLGIRIVAGTINSDGTLSLGTNSDFSSSRVGTGAYKITISTAPTYIVAVSATPISPNASPTTDYKMMAIVSSVGGGVFYVQTENTSGFVDSKFSFVAVCSRDNMGL